ncbi:unnamed protein product [Arabis nemorensis]|uniref:Uncharacterized protein n=1 Tax=Arabis nemorensis TaxID=586526 RepID=A0A565BH36_9BRAS|nr:unnamed protein product [Arabis nemorensis]
MAMAQKDRNTRFVQQAFETVDKVNGKSPKITPKPFVPRDQFPSRFNQSSTEHIPSVGGARPSTSHANWVERPNGRVVSCDEAFKLYGGMLIKEFW